MDTSNIIVTEAGCVGRVVSPNHYFISVIPVQPVPGTQPDKPAAILENDFDGAVGQPLLIGKMGKTQPGRLTLALGEQGRGEDKQ
jgi:hypothetical protein